MLRFSTAALLTAATLACSGLDQTVRNGAGYKAKALASGVFVSGRAAERVIRDDLSDGPMVLVSGRVDPEDRSASARALGVVGSKAICREGLGCTLVEGLTEEEIRSQPHEPPPVSALDPAEIPWPSGDALPEGPPRMEGVDAAKLDAALDEVFSEPTDGGKRETRAVVVVYRGSIVAERYAKGFDTHTPLPGWSMTKSVVAALVGIRVGKGTLNLQAPAPVPEWRGPGDPRGAITLDQLMRMSGGLEFGEDTDAYDADLATMLFDRGDAAAYAAAKPLVHTPDSHWHYSSGTANIVSRILRQSFEGDQAAHFRFPREALFDRIGMGSAVIEPDASGSFVGSSFMFATARDWARFGLLFLEDGVWEGERILPEGWVEYSTAPTPRAPQGRYGAHWWLNAGEPDDPSDRPWPDLPTDTFSARGFEGQEVVVIPSRELVLVRLGQARPESTYSSNDFGAAVLACISHQLATAAADSTASSRPSPSGRLDVLPSTPSASRLCGLTVGKAALPARHACGVPRSEGRESAALSAASLRELVGNAG
jgi:CubicO group peptidase (beta-lactamase class C family)